MKPKFLNPLLAVVILFLCNCTTTSNRKKHEVSVKKIISANKAVPNQSDDSMKLTKLVRALYKWHVTTNGNDEAGAFEPKKKNPSDTLYANMDLAAHENAVGKLRATGLFSEDFLNDYRNIAIRMDKELRSGVSSWREGDLPPFNDDVDSWCDCQDYPDDYWDKLTLKNIKFKNHEASFFWVWSYDPHVTDDKFSYKIKAKKINDVWKISYMDGFDMKSYNWAK